MSTRNPFSQRARIVERKNYTAIGKGAVVKVPTDKGTYIVSVLSRKTSRPYRYRVTAPSGYARVYKTREQVYEAHPALKQALRG